MKASKSIPQQRRLPADVAAVNDIAARVGMVVDVASKGGQAKIVWRGSRSQFRATGLVRKSFPIEGRHYFCYPNEHGGHYYHCGRPFIAGIAVSEEEHNMVLNCEMPLPESIEIVKGVEVCRFDDRVSWYGSAEALEALGVCTAKDLPVGKRAVKSIESVDVYRYVRRHPNGLMICYAETEKAAAARRHKYREWGFRSDYERAIEDEEKELRHMPQSAEAYREKQVAHWEHWYEDTFGEFFGETKYHGYAYAQDVLRDIEARLQAIRGLLETGRVLFSKERHQARIAELRAKVAGADPVFASFINRLTK